MSTASHTLSCEELPYISDSAHYFERIIHHSKPVFLDSGLITKGQPAHENARFDILSAEPSAWIQVNTKQLEIETLTKIEQWYATHQVRINDYDHLPFVGGIIAGFNYELGHVINQIGSQHQDSQDPVFYAGFYPWCIVQDHNHKKAYFISINEYTNQDIISIKQSLKEKASTKITLNKSFACTQKITTNIPKTQYIKDLSKVHEYILSGDCYQINYAQQYQGSYKGDPWQAYKALRKTALAPFSAYWKHTDQHILCASPERFLSINDKKISTKPIKGTRPRGDTPREDAQLAQALSMSIKDCAENLMIVDLLRNDLGKNCRTGSINVDKLFDVETFTTVHHLVSEISGVLNDDITHLRAFLDCFPGGSITGAPKIRAMQIIEELEHHSRQLYCGSIAYFSAHGRSDSNICIRTFICKQGTISTWAGGGIVADSDHNKEFDECGYKIQRLIDSIEQA